MRYETTRDRIAQRAVADILERKWRATMIETAKFCAVDFIAYRGTGIHALVEIKCRDNRSDKYDSLFLAFQKWEAMKRASIEAFNLKILYVVQYTDGIKFADLRFLNFRRLKTKMDGRRDRTGPNAIEPMIHLPIKYMRDL